MKRTNEERMKKILILLLLFVCCYGCNQPSSMEKVADLLIYNSQYRDVPICHLESADTLLSFSDLYPVSLDISDTILYIIHAKGDSCLIAFHKNTGEECWRGGAVGIGPDDCQSPRFMKNTFSAEDVPVGGIRLYDMNTRRLLLLNATDRTMTFAPMPSLLGEWTNINLTKKTAVGVNMAQQESMFQICDFSTGESLSIEPYFHPSPEVAHRAGDALNYMLSTSVVSNDVCDRIIVPMYFFDVYLVYDFSGKLLRTVSLSRDAIQVDEQILALMEQQDYVGYNQCYATSDACYLKRYIDDGKTHQVKQCQIVKTDWNGEVKKIFVFDQPLAGSFCVDGNDLFCIVNLPQGAEDYYHILRYQLP